VLTLYPVFYHRSTLDRILVLQYTSVKKQDISQKERRALVTKRFIDELWSNLYWITILGTHGDTKLRKKALSGLANIPA